MKTAFLIVFAVPALAVAAVGFGDAAKRRGNPRCPPADSEVANPNPTLRPPRGQDWITVPFEKAENEVLALFGRDIKRISDITNEIVVFEVRTSGQLPDTYASDFRNKLERLILMTNSVKLKDCTGCDQARLFRNSDGEVRYESNNSDPKRAAKFATDLGVYHFLYAELSYTPEDLKLRIRLVSQRDRTILFTGDYSTEDVIRVRETAIASGDIGGITTGDSLARVVIGEIAFAVVLAPGVLSLPSINAGGGSAQMFYPSVDLLIGERYDRGHKRFGFLFGAAVNMALGPAVGKPLPFVMRIAPQFRYSFNPYAMRSTRYSVTGELGGMISTGMVTPYIGFGPEFMMEQRFAVNLVPMYIFPSAVSGAQIYTEAAGGGLEPKNAPNLGTFGGFAVLIKGSINW